MIGFKYKMSNIQAALGCAQLERIDELMAGKRRVFKAYQARLAGLSAQAQSRAGWNCQRLLDADRGFRS